jgi:hypothetical protein
MSEALFLPEAIGCGKRYTIKNLFIGDTIDIIANDSDSSGLVNDSTSINMLYKESYTLIDSTAHNWIII